MCLSPTIGTAALALAASVSLAAPAETVVVMPFTNLSGVERAPAYLGDAVSRRIAAQGYRAAPAEEVEAFLAAERVRYLDSLAAPVREKLLQKFGGSAVLFGTVYDAAEGVNAIVGISARMVGANGAVRWAGVTGLTTEDTEGALGFHRTSDAAVLSEKALERLLKDFPAPGGTLRLASARARPLGLAAPVTFRSPTLDSGREHRVCLLPFENRSSARLAPRAVSELLSQRLAASGLFEIVEPAEFRQAMIAAEMRGLRGADPAALSKLGRTLGTSLFLRGTIYVFKDASPANPGLPPELDLDLALVDVAAGRILWTSRIARKGTDYSGLLLLGTITNAVTLTDQAASEIVRAVETTKERAKRSVTAAVTAANKTYDGTPSGTITECTLTGLLGSDAGAVTCAATAALFSDANAGTGKTVTASGITIAGSAAGFYALSSPTATSTANINRKAVSAEVTASPKPYDGTPAAAISSCSLTGPLPVDAARVKCSAAAASFSDPRAGDGKTVTASGIGLSGTAAGNYALSSTTATATASIGRRPVTAAVTAGSKIYDGTDAASIRSCTLSGVVADDSVAVSCEPAGAAFADAGVGAGKTVTAAGLELSGLASPNYELPAKTATARADITPRPVTASIRADGKIYDGTSAAAIPVCELADVVPSDASRVGCGASGAAFSDKLAGTGKAVAASVALSGEAARNYVLSSASAKATAEIRPRVLTVSGVNAANKIYDATREARLDTSRAALENKVGGDDVALDASRAAGAFPDRNVGPARSVAISGLELKGRDAGNYVLTQPSARADVTPYPVDPHVTAESKVYDGATAATLSSRSLTEVLPPDANDVKLTVKAAAFETKSAGAAKIVKATGLALEGSVAGNYILTMPEALAKADVAPRRVTGSFTASDKEYDGTVAAVVRTQSLRATLAGDDVALSGGTAAFGDKNVGSNKPVSLTNAALSGADAGNYELDTVGSASASIAPRRVRGTFAAEDKESDGTAKATVRERSLEGTIPGDDVSLTGGTARFADASVGTGKVVRLTGAKLSGADARNYVLDSVSPTTASITPRRKKSSQEK